MTDEVRVTNKMVNVALDALGSLKCAGKPEREAMRIAIRSALGHLPYGWQIVPKEPTHEMVEAGLQTTAAWRDFSGSAYTVNRKKMTVRYKAMIAAAPLPSLTGEK